MLRHLVDPRKLRIPTAAEALTGRRDPAFAIPEAHFVNGHPLKGPWPAGHELALFGFGCFWGAERKMWLVPGVYSTQVGYAGGHTPNPTYEEVCSGRTGHNEVVRVVFDPKIVSFAELVRVFFESHDPTQGMRQGNDLGTQYRSGIYVYDAAQKKTAEAIHAAYDTKLRAAGLESITTEVVDAPTFYFAEAYHQQYLGKNPNGYCGLGGTGIGCPTGVDVSAS